MKNKNYFHYAFLMFMAVVIVFSSCKKKKEETPNTNIIPSSFKVAVPSSINSAPTSKSVNTDTLNGNVIYENLRNFINVGCAASDVVQTIMTAIYANNINQAMSFTFLGHEDGRTKNAVVIEGATLNGVSYQFKMTITDGSSNAIQVFWNTNPVKGVAIMSPYDINRTLSTIYTNTRYQVEYSEAESSYQKQMIVSISNFPKLISTNTNYINNMKMFVGKNGDLLTLWGNSNHPEATIVDPALIGKDYAFVAHSNDAVNIGVAKVGISPTTVTTTTDLFTTYSVYNVLYSAIQVVYPTATQSQINSFLNNTGQPAYFTSPQGFVSCGTTIPNNSAFTSSFIDLAGLTPYIPNDIKNLTISFQ